MQRRRILVALLVPAGFALASATWTPAVAGNPASPWGAVLVDGETSAVPVFRLVVAPANNKARYRIKERLAGMELPYDAVGETDGVAGEIVFDDKGAVVPQLSLITVDVTRLKSDKSRRDSFVQERLLETERFPNVDLVPTSVRGLPNPLPTTGTRSFVMVGNLTVHGVTRPTSWQVSARFQDKKITGTAVTKFTFSDFRLTQPRVPIVLSLADTIQLEYDFEVTREALSGTTVH